LEVTVLSTALVTDVIKASAFAKVSLIETNTVSVTVTTLLLVAVLGDAVDTLLEVTVLSTALVTRIVEVSALAEVSYVETCSVSITVTTLLLVAVLGNAVDTLLEVAVLSTALVTDVIEVSALVKVAYVETCTVGITLTVLNLVAVFSDAVDTLLEVAVLSTALVTFVAEVSTFAKVCDVDE
jgi:hypothetical protein